MSDINTIEKPKLVRQMAYEKQRPADGDFGSDRDSKSRFDEKQRPADGDFGSDRDSKSRFDEKLPKHKCFYCSNEFVCDEAYNTTKKCYCVNANISSFDTLINEEVVETKYFCDSICKALYILHQK